MLLVRLCPFVSSAFLENSSFLCMWIPSGFILFCNSMLYGVSSRIFARYKLFVLFYLFYL